MRIKVLAWQAGHSGISLGVLKAISLPQASQIKVPGTVMSPL